MSRARCAWTVALLLLACCSRTPSAPPSASASSGAPPASAVAAPDDVGDPLELQAQREWEGGKREDIIYVPTPHVVVDKMLGVARVTSSDVVYDLGCGDGRIVVTAAKKIGAKAIGFDLDPQRVSEARENVAREGVGALASIRRANVVMLYLLPELNVRLIPQLEKLRPGARIVSHDFDMEGVIPDGHWTVMAPEFVNSEGYSAYKGGGVPEDEKNYTQRAHEIYLWTVPLKKASTRGAEAGAKNP
jgi:SAM-dependent methyltransferase